MKKSIIIMIAAVAMIATACKKDRTPGTTNVGVGVNYKTNGTVDTISYAIDSFASLSFPSMSMNLDSISKVLYASSSTPSSALFKSVSLDMPDYFWDKFFENNVSLYVSATGIPEKLYGTTAIGVEEHIMKFTPNSDLNLTDYISKGELKFRAKAELLDATDITETIPLKLGSEVSMVFPN
jgi:hypothetical protein